MVLGIVLPQKTVAFAETAESYSAAFDSSNVLDDLTASDSFKLSDYPANANGKLALLNFSEYCYSGFGDQKDYGLYVYLYNPQQLNIDKVSPFNKIQMAIDYNSNGAPSEYFKFQLKFLSASEGDYDKLFYKFKINDIELEKKTFADRVQKEARRYDISGFEILETTSNTPKEYSVGGTWTFTGFAKGFGEGAEEKSTLSVSLNELETIQLDVYHTYYRPEIVSSLGANHQNTINSVYFSIDNEILETYGKLQKIKAEWNEYKTEPIILTNNQDVYSALFALRGQKLSNIQNLKYGIGTADFKSYYLNGTYFDYDFDWSYNVTPNTWSETGITVGANRYYKVIDDGTQDEMIKFVFNTGNINPEDYILSGETLEEYIYSYKESYEKGKLFEKISLDLFSDNIDRGRTRGYNLVEIDSDDKMNLLAYDTSHNSWDKFWDYLIFSSIDTSTNLQIDPIHLVSDDEMKQQNSAICENLYINSDDVEDFKSFYNQEKLKNKKVVLFRFAQTDYYSKFAYILTPKEIGYDISSKEAYVSSETIFFNFDIIQLTFNREGTYTVIPVVASPINVIPDVTPPLEPESNPWWKTLIYIALAVIAAILILRFLPNIIEAIIVIIKWIFYIIVLPFKAISKLTKRRKKR